MRLQEFLGVYETGYARGPAVPKDTRVTLELFRSVHYEIPIFIVNTQGVPVDLSAVSTNVIMTIKKRITDHATIYQALITKTTGYPGRGSFTIDASVLDFVTTGSYLWEVMLNLDGVRSPVIPLSPCVIQASGTRYAC
jgi:hypothetical protein